MKKNKFQYRQYAAFINREREWDEKLARPLSPFSIRRHESSVQVNTGKKIEIII
jgi:hypothetical protein